MEFNEEGYMHRLVFTLATKYKLTHFCRLRNVTLFSTKSFC